MWLSRLRAYRQRTLAIGLVLTAAGAVAFATLSRQANEPLSASDRSVTFEPIAARADDPTGVVKLEAALPEPAEQGEDPSPEAPPSPEPASPAETPPVPLTTPVAEAFEQLAVVDPLTNSEVQPIEFPELPAVETPAPAADAESDVPLYVPGSIGKAKRQWAGGDAVVEKRNGRGFVVTSGGGHCPVPGRVIPPYKMPWS
jgi:hypothetical protein